MVSFVVRLSVAEGRCRMALTDGVRERGGAGARGVGVEEEKVGDEDEGPGVGEEER
jgi:hypothetical protein